MSTYYRTQKMAFWESQDKGRPLASHPISGRFCEVSRVPFREAAVSPRRSGRVPQLAWLAVDRSVDAEFCRVVVGFVGGLILGAHERTCEVLPWALGPPSLFAAFVFKMLIRPTRTRFTEDPRSFAMRFRGVVRRRVFGSFWRFYTRPPCRRRGIY